MLRKGGAHDRREEDKRDSSSLWPGIKIQEIFWGNALNNTSSASRVEGEDAIIDATWFETLKIT